MLYKVSHRQGFTAAEGTKDPPPAQAGGGSETVENSTTGDATILLDCS